LERRRETSKFGVSRAEDDVWMGVCRQVLCAVDVVVLLVLVFLVRVCLAAGLMDVVW
jgi:hypothetical protein